MMLLKETVVLLLVAVYLCLGTYTPRSEKKKKGKVVLPATRRGRYLANIIRRQAIDGTRIAFSRNADKINAESKKKVDVLSDELLPYIIAEQDRRVALQKRVMTAIQNGEKGITVAELRNKPPVLIRRGKLYRCPANNSPKEPDGSGSIKCENNKDATEIIFDSCLSAEDRELFNVADTNKYYFCNRREADEPDDSRNGTTVIGCPPTERTSYEYSLYKCAVVDTDDVVVHYRYYPDHSYKYVADIDPERELCDNWNPCQIAYMFSLPKQELATIVTEVYHYEKIVPGEPQVTDNGIRVWVPRKQIKYYPPDVLILPSDADTKSPDFKIFHKKLEDITETELISPDKDKGKSPYAIIDGKVVINCNKFTRPDAARRAAVGGAAAEVPDPAQCYGTYTAQYKVKVADKDVTKRIKLYEMVPSQNNVKVSLYKLVPGQVKEKATVQYYCSDCKSHGITVRRDDGSLGHFDSSRFSNIRTNSNGQEQQFYEIDLSRMDPKYYGDYFVRSISHKGDEEFIKIASARKDDSVKPKPVNEKLKWKKQIAVSGRYGEPFEIKPSAMYECAAAEIDGENNCKIDDVFCNGRSLVRPKDSIMSTNKTGKSIGIKIEYFTSEFACVLVGVVKYKRKADDEWAAFDPKKYSSNTGYKILGLIENIKVDPLKKRNTHVRGADFDHVVTFTCDPCDKVDNVTQVLSVSVNGILLDKKEWGTPKSAGNYFKFDQQYMSILVHISPFSAEYEGVFMAWFKLQKNCDVCDAAKEIFRIAESVDGPADGDAKITLTPPADGGEEGKALTFTATAAFSGSCAKAEGEKAVDQCEVIDVTCNKRSVTEMFDAGVVKVEDLTQITFNITSYDQDKYGMCVYVAVINNGQQKPIGGIEYMLTVTAGAVTTPAEKGKALAIATKPSFKGPQLDDKSLVKIFSAFHDNIIKNSKDPVERTYNVTLKTGSTEEYEIAITIPKLEIVDSGPYYGLFKNHQTGMYWVKQIIPAFEPELKSS